MKNSTKIIFFSLVLLTLFNCSENSSPETSSAPSGPSTAEAHSYLSYTFSTTDPDGDDISYQFDWGDGNLSEWTDFMEAGQTISQNYVWRETGTFSIKVRAMDTKEKISDWSEALAINIVTCTNFPPNTPSAPSGIDSGFAHTTYTFYTGTTDPEGDSISYQFDWGDGNLSYWTDFMESGDTVSVNHAWQDTGNYNINVRAIDTRNKISIWSEAHPINIYTNLPPNQPLAPSGVDSGFGDTTYTFYASTTDPEGDSISYQFDWGDGNLTYWTDFHPAGDIVSMEHFWSYNGIYSIKVHAKDINNLESDWSAEHQIHILSNGTPPPEDSFPDKVITVIDVGDGPMGFDFLPNGEYAYITNCNSNDIYLIKTSDHTVADIFPLGSEPNYAAALPNGEYVYVTDHHDSCAYVMRTSDNEVIDTIKLGGGPHTIVSLPNGEYLYATNSWTNEVSVIRTSDNTVVATIPVGEDPRGIEALPNGEYVYVACMGPSRVYVIRTSDNTVVDNIQVNHWPHTITTHPDGDYVYATWDFGSEIYVIETSTNTLVKNITVGNTPKGIAVLPTGDYIYVSNRASSSISVIRESDNTIVKTIPVQYAPLYMKSAPNGEFLYVTHGRSDIVTVIGY